MFVRSSNTGVGQLNMNSKAESRERTPRTMASDCQGMAAPCPFSLFISPRRSALTTEGKPPVQDKSLGADTGANAWVCPFRRIGKLRKVSVLGLLSVYFSTRRQRFLGDQSSCRAPARNNCHLLNVALMVEQPI